MQKSWTEAVVMCNLRISIMENKDFRRALEISQPMFNRIDRLVSAIRQHFRQHY